MSKLKITCYEYQNLLYKLYKEIKHSEIVFNYVMGIPRGGLGIAQHLSHYLEIPLVLGISENIIDRKNHYLIVDEICDTGKTLSDFDDYYHRRISYDTAVLHLRQGSKFLPTFIAEDKILTNDIWVCYPWEKSVINPEEEIKKHKLKCEE